MKPEVKSALISFSVELAVYAILITGYYFLVLHLMGDWLQILFTRHRVFYAAIALILILVQGVFLETLTRFLLSLVKRNGGQS